MKDNPEKNYQQWFTKADEDCLSANAILKDKDGAPSTVCFLSQQMAEKYLKGMLVFYGQEFPKVHDLLELESLLLEKTLEIKEFHEELKLLNRYYIETRYPGDFPEGFYWKDAEEALDSAQKIKEFVLTTIDKIV